MGDVHNLNYDISEGMGAFGTTATTTANTALLATERMPWQMVSNYNQSLDDQRSTCSCQNLTMEPQTMPTPACIYHYAGTCHSAKKHSVAIWHLRLLLALRAVLLLSLPVGLRVISVRMAGRGPPPHCSQKSAGSRQSWQNGEG